MLFTYLTLSGSLLLAPPAPAAAPAPGGPGYDFPCPQDEEFDKRYAEAGKNPEKLWKLYLWCDSTERDRRVRKVLLRLVRVEPDHMEAREILGHVRYDRQWFTTEKKLAAYKRKEAERLAKEQGLVKHDGEWVHPDDIPFLDRGLVKDESGLWVSAEDLERTAAGWVRQDLVWIPPDEIPKIEEGLWKCGDEWKTLEEADEYHNELGLWWAIPGDNVIVWSSCERAVALKALDEMERGFRDMVRIYGRAPSLPVQVAVLRNEFQLMDFGQGDAAYGHPPTDQRELVRSCRAIFAESWFDTASKRWRGMGATYWDAHAEHGDNFGVHDVRMAMGLSFADAIDPSSKTVAKAERDAQRARGAWGPSGLFVDEFLAEKSVPLWFRYGSAAYASRYYEAVVDTGGDPWWVRKWSLQNIAAQGDLDPLGTIFDLRIASTNPDSSKLMSEAGLLVAFVLDGGCEPVTREHEALLKALREGKDPRKIFQRLRKQIEKHEAELRAFAGLS